MSIRRSLVVLLLLVLIAPPAYLLLQAQQAQRAASAAAQAVASLQSYTIAPGTIEVTVNAVGRVEAAQSTRLSFSGAGRVMDVFVEDGDRVQAGDVLAQLDTTLAQIAVDTAQIALETAQLRRDQLDDGPSESEIAVAEADIAAAEAAVAAIANAVSDEQLTAAALGVERAQQAYDAAVQARATAPGGQSEAAYALLDAQVGEASFNLEIARQQLAALQSGSSSEIGAAQARVSQAEARLAQLLAPPTEAEIAQADAAIEQARIQLAEAQSALDDLQLTAPYDGLVTNLALEVGALVGPSLPAVTLLDVDPLRLTVQVDEIDVRRIREGQPAVVTFDALPGVQAQAVLERIALVGSAVNGVINYEVIVRLNDDIPAGVLVGMTAEARVTTETRADVLVVPNAFIRLDRSGMDAFVNVIEDGVLREVPVELGLQGDDSSEIVAGLRAGDVIGVNLTADSVSGFLGG